QHRLTAALRQLAAAADPGRRLALARLLSERLGRAQVPGTPVDLQHIPDLASAALNTPTGVSTVLEAVRATQLPADADMFARLLTPDDTPDTSLSDTPDTAPDDSADSPPAETPESPPAETPEEAAPSPLTAQLTALLDALPLMRNPIDHRMFADTLRDFFGRPAGLPGTGPPPDASVLARVTLDQPEGLVILAATVEEFDGAEAAAPFHLLAAPTPEPAVRGPLPLPSDGAPPTPATPDTALVYARPDGSLTLTAPDETDLAWEYYEVDLAEREVHLDGGLGARALARVDDPVEAAQDPGLNLTAALAERLEAEAARLPVPAAMDKLRRRLDRWPVPGYAVRWRLPQTDPRTLPERPAATAEDPVRLREELARIVDTAECVLIGFDGPLARLYRRSRDARRAAQ
ncbi:hypothetical protein G3I40_10875, partial [Streptomyces sp. SID14478]|nr:hypothetical protein [Streptomyces sp. SID14478]